MTKAIVNALTAATLISGAVFLAQPAAAMGFKNCTGEQIRLKIYNNHDVEKIVARKNIIDTTDSIIRICIDNLLLKSVREPIFINIRWSDRNR